MEINLTGDNLEITDAISDYVNKKLNHLKHRGKHIIRIHVVISSEKLKKKVTANVEIAGPRINASAIHDDLYAAIDVLENKLSRLLVDHHSRETTHH